MIPETHLFILWQRARYNEEKILQDMKQHFTLLKCYAITWTPDLVSSNFTRFYGVNLPPKSGKEKECGTGEFLLCIVRDENPLYAERKTSRGPEVVNTNMFDAKQRYRDWTRGGHKVHATNSEKETNHDLTLLLGKNINDFIAEYPTITPNTETLHKDIEGASGWNSLRHLFYVLNNTVSYVILRGVTENKDNSFLDNSDTDILTTDYQNTWYIINGEAVYHHVRPKAKIIVNGQMFYLDVWDAQKNYFDSVWVEQMLKTAVSYHGMRILNSENDFYCLLYHCLTNKGFIADKYTAKLLEYKHENDIKENDWAQILVDWLQRNHYDIIEHTDPSNPFNLSNQIIRDYALRFGICIRVVRSIVKDIKTNESISWISRVYKKPHS